MMQPRSISSETKQTKSTNQDITNLFKAYEKALNFERSKGCHGAVWKQSNLKGPKCGRLHRALNWSVVTSSVAFTPWSTRARALNSTWKAPQLKRVN
jgi:hypothetical protein